MLIIHVKHYLNADGMRYFDSWFLNARNYVSKQDGFKLLERAFDNTDLEVVHIWLHFEGREKMQGWGDSAEHAKLIAKLDPYRTQAWEATWYDTDQACVENFIIPLGQH